MEMLIVIALTALISGVIGYLIQFFYKTSGYALQESIAVAEARHGVEDAMRYLREATYGSDGSYPIQTAATSSIVFFAKVDNNESVERITYLLSNGTLYRGVASPTGSPPTYVGAVTSTSTVAKTVKNATSSPIFRYFNNAGVELTAPYTLSSIASIQTTLTIDVDVNRTPVPFTLSGGATLRNLQNQP